MRSHRDNRFGRTIASAIGVVVALTAMAQVALADSATVTPYSYRITSTYEAGLPECLSPELIAVGTVVEFGNGSVVENSGGTTVHGFNGMTYHLALSDGRVVDGSAAGHFVTATHGTVSVYTETVREPRTIYATDGTAVGRVLIHFLAHVTYHTDTNAVSAQIENFRFTCG